MLPADTDEVDEEPGHEEVGLRPPDAHQGPQVYHHEDRQPEDLHHRESRAVLQLHRPLPTGPGFLLDVFFMNVYSRLVEILEGKLGEGDVVEGNYAVQEDQGREKKTRDPHS